MACWISSIGISQNSKCLTTTPSKINLAPVTTAAGFRHPGDTSIGIKGWGRIPNITQSMFGYIPKL